MNVLTDQVAERLCARLPEKAEQKGIVIEKDLSVRVHVCPECGLELDRDVNAARNVLQKAFHSLGLSDQDLTWAVASSVS
jgi:transposase